MERVSYVVEINVGISFEGESKEDLPFPDTVKEAFLFQLKECFKKHTDWNATINKLSIT